MTEISGYKKNFETKSLDPKECNALRFNTFELDLASEIESKTLFILKCWKLSKDTVCLYFLNIEVKKHRIVRAK